MKPMLFNTDMVRAILAGTKTVTRRVIKPQPDKRLTEGNGRDIMAAACAPYKTGDILYIRETWATTPNGQDYLYQADATTAAGGFIGDKNGKLHAPRWHPSIHMPYEAARLFLKVKNVRVEHLQDITERGAFDEGLYKGWRDKTGDFAPSARVAFSWLWDTTIKPADRKRYSWGANPWVWVTEFERCERPKEV